MAARFSSYAGGSGRFALFLLLILWILSYNVSSFFGGAEPPVMLCPLRLFKPTFEGLVKPKGATPEPLTPADR